MAANSPSALSTGVQLHLTTGRKHWFSMENEELAAAHLDDLDCDVFARESLVVDGTDEVASIPGRALIGITVLSDVLPERFLARERLSKSVVTQISLETAQYSRQQLISKYEGMSGALLSEIEFVSGERLYLELSDISETAKGEPSVMHHLFSQPSVISRRPEGGFSIWNTAHIVSWSHYPRLDAPVDSWPAGALDVPITEAARMN